MPEEVTEKVNITEEVETSAIKTTTAKPRAKRRTTGAGSDLLEIAENGKPKSKKVHQVYNKSDNMDSMVQKTVDLISNTTRQIIKEAEKQETSSLSGLVDKNYVPRRPSDNNAEDDLENILDMVCTF